MKSIEKIGFMQGRLSPIIENKIQAFPWETWSNEFSIANKIDLKIMEWTLDYKDLYKNPLMTGEGKKKINKLSKKYNLSIPSLTGDCFMQAPFWKSKNSEEENQLKKDLISILENCNQVGIKFIVIPLVDEGRIDNLKEEQLLISFLKEIEDKIYNLDQKILFESDFNPRDLEKFISKFNDDLFGINYDTGNSASYGFNPIEEFDAYGDKILNVHIKDRPLGRTTVPLGEGDVDFDLVFKLLDQISYRGNYILQTARALDDNHEKTLKNYKNFVETRVTSNGSRS